MTIERRNAKKRFCKPILSVLRIQMNIHLNSLYIHCNGYSQIFFENLLPNRRFGVEIVLKTLFRLTITIIAESFVLAQGSCCQPPLKTL